MVIKQLPLSQMRHWLKRLYLRRYRYLRYDPKQIYYVDPSTIRLLTGREWTGPTEYNLECRYEFIPEFDLKKHERQQKVPLGAVRGGSWDKSVDKFTDLTVYKGIKERFRDCEDWTDTILYEKHNSRIRSGNRSYGCVTSQQLKEKLYAIDDLYEAIKTDGYRSQQELNGSMFDEITVNIGRDGSVIFNRNGRHRLSIAKLLDLDQVPVFVMVRHERLFEPISKNISESRSENR